MNTRYLLRVAGTIVVATCLLSAVAAWAAPARVGAVGPHLAAPTATPTPEGWTRHSAADFELWLPDAWWALEISPETVKLMGESLREFNPDWAQMADAMVSNAESGAMKFFAFDTVSGSFATNVNIIAQPAPVPLPMKAMLAMMKDMYADLGVTVVSVEDDLTFNGLPAAAIHYTMVYRVAGGKDVTVSAVQYLVFGEDTAYALTFSTDPGQLADYTPIFERSAQSFRVVGMPPTAEPLAGNEAEVVADSADLRTGPGTEYPVVRTLEQHARVYLLGRDSGADWLEVQSATTQEIGWVSTSFLRTSADLSELPVVSEAAAPTRTVTPTATPLPETTGTPTPGFDAVVTVEAGNLRAGPGTDYNIIGLVQRGDGLQVLGKNEAGDWVNVVVATQEEQPVGWLSVSLIE